MLLIKIFIFKYKGFFFASALPESISMSALVEDSHGGVILVGGLNTKYDSLGK